MKKSTILSINLYLLFCFIFNASIYSQDFGKLLDAVEQIESNLKDLVNKEATMRSKEIDQLKTEMNRLKQRNTDAFDGSIIADIKDEIEKLHQQVESLSGKNKDVQFNDTDVVTIINDIEFLKAENLYLRRLFESNQKQLVSADEQSQTLAFDNLSKPMEESSLLKDNSPVSVSGLNITGFFDVVGTRQNSADDETDFGLGQAEIDLENELSEIAAISVAVAYNNETGNFEVGAAELGLNLFTQQNSFFTSIDVVAGQFDVPFGIDYQVYASIDRKLITEPWFADIHGGWRGWNDFGVQFQATSQYGNFVGYWVNGFEESAKVTQRIINLTTGLEEDTTINVNTTPADAFGGRVGLNPFANLEIGGSFAVGFNQTGKNEMLLTGADVQLTFNDFFLKGEYLYHSVNRTVAKEGHRGFYLQPIYYFSRIFITARYSSFKPEGADWIGQLSLGGGYSILEGVELRLETIFSENKDDNQNLLQLVAGF